MIKNIILLMISATISVYLVMYAINDIHNQGITQGKAEQLKVKCK